VNIGILWYDQNPKTPLAQKVYEAAERYREKFGVAANTCYVNPVMLDSETRVPGFELRTRASIRPHHYWVGMAADAQPAPATQAETAANGVDTAPRRRRRAA